MRPLIVTLDGPAGSGKSTVARRLAQRLGLRFLDTGAMYRGLAAACLDHGIDTAGDPARVIEFAQHCRFRFDWETDPPRLHIHNGQGDVDMTDRLRDADVTVSVSDVAAIPEVRSILVEAQKKIGADFPWLVTEGRDQGSVVFPEAHAKFYLEAQPQVRAQRRSAQLRDAGKPVDETQILQQIVTRDHKDSTRRSGPLICPPDALRIDTSAMSLDEVVDHVERCVRQRCAQTLREARPTATSPHGR
ncbi:MAG: (d)CMP kinase [Phycisphaeraceae bacterium]